MNTLEHIEQYLQDNSVGWNWDKRRVFYLAIDNYLWQKTKTLMTRFLLLPTYVKAEIILYLAFYPEHLYALSNDPQLSRPSLNGVWCEIYKRKYNQLPSFPRFTEMSMMSIYMAKSLDNIYRDKRTNLLRNELLKVGCELRADSDLCRKWIDNCFNKCEDYYHLTNVVHTMFVINILFKKYNMKTELSKYYSTKFPNKKITEAEQKIGFSIVKAQMLQKISDNEIENEKARVLRKYTHMRNISSVFAPGVAHLSNRYIGEFKSAHYIMKIIELLDREQYYTYDCSYDSDDSYWG